MVYYNHAIGKKMFLSLFKTIEKFLNFDYDDDDDDDDDEDDDEDDNDDLGDNDDIEKKSKHLQSSTRRSKRKTVTPIRYGYDE